METIIIPIVILYGCVAVTPFVAVGGALIGGSGSDAAKANRAAKARHRAEVKELRPIIDAALDTVTTDTPLRDGLLAQAQARTHHAFVSVPASDSKKPDKRAHYGRLESEGIDTVLEVSVPRLDFAADYAFALTAQARLIRVRDNAVLYTGTYTFGHGTRGIFQWTADGGDKLSSALASAYQGLAEKIVDDVFLLQPLPLARLGRGEILEKTSDRIRLRDSGPVQAIYNAAEAHCRKFNKRNSLIAAPPENSDYVFVCSD